LGTGDIFKQKSSNNIII